MIKTAPTRARIIAMALFAFSCVAILMFLWLDFGGSLPLQPQEYRVQAAFREATHLVSEVDVRMSGVTVGRVKEIARAPHENRTLATLEIDPQYAPIPRDTRAILRQKTLGGETYVELSPGNRAAGPLPDGGRLPDGQIDNTTEFDEILDALDPKTRKSLRSFYGDQARSISGRSEDLSNALGNFAPFAVDGSELLQTLHLQDQALGRLVRDSGSVFQAVTQNEGQLHNLITGTHDVFSATASQSNALVQTFAIFPTFLDETKATMARLERFSGRARPLVRELRPVARDLAPTARATRQLAPDLRHFFGELPPLARTGSSGLPATRSVIEGSTPLFTALTPFLEQLNPVLQWLSLNQYLIGDFLSNPGTAAQAITPDHSAGAVGNYLRQLTVTGNESFALYRDRDAGNRGNAYLPPTIEYDKTVDKGIFPNFDCDPSGGEVGHSANPKQVACFVLTPLEFQGRGQGRFAHVEPNDYSAGASPAARR